MPCRAGFRFAATNCGLRKAPNLDLGLIIGDEEVTAAGVFTQNLVQAAPVVLCRRHLGKAGSRMRAVIVNSREMQIGATGEAGMAAADSYGASNRSGDRLRSGTDVFRSAPRASLAFRCESGTHTRCYTPFGESGRSCR